MIEHSFDAVSHTLTYKFAGRMDTFVCTEEGPVVDAQLAEASKLLATDGLPPSVLKVVFDVRGVNYIASFFIRICLMVAKAVEKGNFSIVNTDPQVKKVFIIAGLDKMLQVS
ncbi:MAG: STAS domain-containing protein [Deltaproteobacteria bacterium]|nr:STAS domain-containing protein [Deltaproteobacteria bacterium]